MRNNFKPDNTWTLFLDRDGVINKRIVDGYVKRTDEFIFLDGVLESLKIFNALFGRIIVVTNQRGIACGIMSSDDLKLVHNYMLAEVNNNGGRIDSIYYCPHDRDEKCTCRKPEPGMLIHAQRDYPEIDFSRSIMVGDSHSDIELGRSKGLHTVFIADHHDEIPQEISADVSFRSLLDFARYLINV
jgi:histidinol-phosphate phosphatase family protein